MGVSSSKSLLRCIILGLRYLCGMHSIPAWKKRCITKSRSSNFVCPKQTIRLVPTTSSFFNLLKGVKERYPQLTYQQVVMIGTQVWNQLTWSEKKPFYLAAWKKQLKREITNRRNHQKYDLARNLETSSPQRRYNLRSNIKLTENQPLEMLTDLPKVRRSKFSAPKKGDSKLFLPIKRDVLTLVNDLLEKSNEDLVKARLKTIIAS